MSTSVATCMFFFPRLPNHKILFLKGVPGFLSLRRRGLLSVPNTELLPHTIHAFSSLSF